MKRIVFFICIFVFNISIVCASNKFKVTLDKCIDGDTARFNIKGEVKTVRFLSINTPEIGHDDVKAEPYGEEASMYTCNLLKNASVIKLQYDPKRDHEDKYDRVLAWVFVDDELLQERLVSEGLAEVKYVYDDYKYSSKLKEIEVMARDNGVGMWSNYSLSSSYNYSTVDLIWFLGILFVLTFIYYFYKKILYKKN